MGVRVRASTSNSRLGRQRPDERPRGRQEEEDDDEDDQGQEVPGHAEAICAGSVQLHRLRRRSPQHLQGRV